MVRGRSPGLHRRPDRLPRAQGDGALHPENLARLKPDPKPLVDLDQHDLDLLRTPRTVPGSATNSAGRAAAAAGRRRSRHASAPAPAHLHGILAADTAARPVSKGQVGPLAAGVCLGRAGEEPLRPERAGVAPPLRAAVHAIQRDLRPPDGGSAADKPGRPLCGVPVCRAAPRLQGEPGRGAEQPSK